jgi:hypothetical protein
MTDQQMKWLVEEARYEQEPWSRRMMYSPSWRWSSSEYNIQLKPEQKMLTRQEFPRSFCKSFNKYSLDEKISVVGFYG